MTTDIVFSLDPAVKEKENFLTVNIRKKDSSGPLYLSILDGIEKESKELTSLLRNERCREAGIAPSSPAAKLLSCDLIRVRPSRSLEVIQKLIFAKKLLWNDRSVFFNPIGKLEVFLTAELIDGEGLILSADLSIDGTFYPFSEVSFLFLSEDESFGICKQIVFVFPEGMNLSWLDPVDRKPKILEGKEMQVFIQRYKEDPPEGFPKTVWKGNYTEEKGQPATVYPVLRLIDSQGAFANLEMDYEDRVVDFTDPKKFPGRNVEAERSWEKDLLETDFKRRPSLDSNYYCPTDKVGKSISFLLEIGWKIFDKSGKRVVKMTSRDLALSSSKEDLIVKGVFSYGEHKANLAGVAGAFNRREKFLDLSSTAVAWLGNEEEYKEIENLIGLETIGEACLLSKKRFGMLGGINFGSVTPEAVPLLKRIKERTGVEKMEDPLFRGSLRPYQEEGREWLRFLRSNRFSGLLADEMGLGKTVQTLAFLSSLVTDKPVLLIAPTSLVFNWKKEWDSFIPHKKLHVHQGPVREGSEFLQKQEAILTSYAYLRIDHLLFSSLYFSVIVLDEAQWIKNPDSALAKAAFRLESDMKLCLTGTPVENRAQDLWSLFRFLEPELLGTKEDYLSTLSSSTLDLGYRERIRKKVKPFILRRRKEEVLPDLPEKIEQVVWVEMEEKQRSFYDNLLARTRKGLLRKIDEEGASARRPEILEAILRLRQACCDPYLVDGESVAGSAKVEKVLADLSEAVLQKRKVVLYSQFTKMLGLLEKRIRLEGWNYAYLDGSTQDREAVVACFQNDPEVPVFLISLKAGGVGLNLTAADYIFLFDPWWNDAAEAQAIGRAHRFGRTEKVVARRYICAESIEEKMMKLKEHKLFLSKGLLDFDSVDTGISLDEMIELLR